MKKVNKIYTQCRHELNHLRVLVQNISILDIPIVEDHFGPDRIFMDEVMPSSGKVGNNMLLELPSGICGQARSIQVESAESKEIVPQVVSSSNADYYIAKDFTEYRQHNAQYSWTAGDCSNVLKPLLKKPTLKWILCMRCLDYSIMGIHHHKPLHCHANGC